MADLNLESYDSVTGSRRLYTTAAVLAVAAVLAFGLDLSVLYAMRAEMLPGDLRKLINLAEVFGHGLGVIAIIVAFCVLDPTRRRGALRLLACAIGAGLVTNLVKILVGRTRPRDHQFQTVWETFDTWCPAISNRDWSLLTESELQSFPSAHTATAVGFAVGLSYFYPHGRWLFAGLAVLVAMQRMQVGAHYLSDTLGGAAVGCLVAGFCCDATRWGRVFERFESGGKDNAAS
jgi:membrane-associated phospholipid phosphatase